jgi:hypothetical protein
MSSKKNETVKKVEAPKAAAVTEQPIKKEVKSYKAKRNFFFAGKNWFEGEVIDLPQKDLDFLVSKEVIH